MKKHASITNTTFICTALLSFLLSCSPSTSLVAINPNKDIVVSESGTSVDLEITLTPNTILEGDQVTVEFISTNTLEISISPTSFTFNKSNESTPQILTVTGIDDSKVDGDKLVEIQYVSTRVSGNTTSVTTFDPLVVTNLDNEDPNDPSVAGITVSTNQLFIFEGGEDTFTVVLDYEPAFNVTVPLDFGSVMGSPSSLTFTPENYNVPQTVTVSVLDDGQDYSLITGNTINIGPTTSDDLGYDALSTTVEGEIYFN